MKFICKIYHDHGDQQFILLNKEFDNLKILADFLGLTYNQLADLSSDKKKKKDYRKFKYYPKIEIEKIYKYNNNGQKGTSIGA